MSSVSGKAEKAVLVAVCVLIASLPACSNGSRRAQTAAVPAQGGPSAPDSRFPPDTVPQQGGRGGEWLFWVIPAGESPGAACYSRGDSEFDAKRGAHSQCAGFHAGRRYYSVGGCTAPQQLTYATSADGNFTWRVCRDPRQERPDAARAEAVRLCQSMSGQQCSAQ